MFLEEEEDEFAEWLNLVLMLVGMGKTGLLGVSEGKLNWSIKEEKSEDLIESRLA